MKQLVRPTFIALAAAFALSIGGRASADKPVKPAATHQCPDGKGGFTTVPENELCPLIVTARPVRPGAVVELGKILPEIDPAKIKQPLVQKIEQGVTAGPF